MNRKLAWTALGIALACAGSWWLFQGAGAGRRAVPIPTAESARAPEGPAPAELAAVERPAAPAPAARERAAEREPAAELPREHQSFALDGARWLDVTVVLPRGAPREDAPALLGFAPRDGEAFQDWHATHLGEHLGLDDSFATETEHHWSRRPLAARVRLPFPAGSREGLLLIQSRYLHLDPRRVDLAGASAITLAPELGGWVTGRCTFPPGTAGVPAEAIEIGLQGREAEDGLMGFAHPDSRDARVGPDLAFELRALPAQRKYVLQAEAEGYLGHFELSFAVAPGEHRELTLAFRPGAAVSGTVRGEGQPLAGVRVLARMRGGGPWNQDRSATSDARGEFRLSALPAGTVTLEASLDGWRTAESEPLTVVENDELRGIELLLDPGLRLSGTVRWPDGTAAAGATVEALEPQRHWLRTLTRTTSDGEGGFVLGGLTEAPVEVFARHAPPGAQGEAGEEESALAALDHEGSSAGAAEPAASSWVASRSAVRPGSVDLVLTLQPPLAVAGRVVDDTGAPCTAFRLQARPVARPFNAPEGVSRDFEAAEDGAFTLALGLPGEWLFTAHSRSGERESAGVLLAVPAASAGLVLVLPRAAAVAGSVVDPSGRPVEGATLHVVDDPEQAVFGLFGGGEETTDADGRFALESVKSPSTIQARHDDWAASEPLVLVLAPGENRTDLVLALRVGARITGQVLDAQGRPEAGQNVNCAPGAMAAMTFGFGGGASTRSDAAGRFVFERVTPGKVTVSALPSEEELLEELQDGSDESASLAMLGGMRTATVEVADGGEAHVVLGAKPKLPVRVHGLVTLAGAPQAEKQVFVLAEGGALFQGMKLARTDAHGRYEVVVDRPGDYVFSVGLGDGMEGTGIPFLVEVPEAPELEQDLALPLGRITGHVLGPDGPADGLALRLVSAEGLIGIDDLSEARRTSTAGDGAFAFQYLEPGRYAIHAASELGESGSFARYGQAVVDGIRVERDRAVEGLVVRLAAPGTLSGTVRDAGGAPVGGVSIYVRDAAGRAISLSSCLSDASGRFTYAGVAPGHVTASARGARLVGPESAPVEVRSGETTQLDLGVAPGAFLRVSLLDGEREVRARLRVVDEAGRRVDDLFSMEDMGLLFAEGFSSRARRVGPLAPGPYTLTATSLDGKDARQSVQVEAGQEERSVRLRLR